MKKIIKPGVREEAEYVCDVTGKPAVATLRMDFGYASSHDMQFLSVDLSDEIANEVLALLQSRFPQFLLRIWKPSPLYVELAEVPPAVIATLLDRARAKARKRKSAK